jgi:cytidyltransferase-like protein
MKILVMGLPGSGKTTFAKVLAEKLEAPYFNADEVRKMFNDWDFSEEGRTRQAKRMSKLCEINSLRLSVVDFVCPTEHTRKIFDAHLTIIMDTIDAGRFEDTNKVFERPNPDSVDFVISEWGDVEEQILPIIELTRQLSVRFKYQLSTGLMIGRFQPFHDGHLKLFEKILEKEGQVLIGVRDTHGLDEKNPFNFLDVVKGIHAKLEEKYYGKYLIMAFPNITGVYYGRDVGYKVEKIDLDPQTESISATQIRKEMGYN